MYIVIYMKYSSFHAEELSHEKRRPLFFLKFKECLIWVKYVKVEIASLFTLYMSISVIYQKKVKGKGQE